MLKNTPTKRNSSIELLRFVLAVLIILGHSNQKLNFGWFPFTITICGFALISGFFYNKPRILKLFITFFVYYFTCVIFSIILQSIYGGGMYHEKIINLFLVDPFVPTSPSPDFLLGTWWYIKMLCFVSFFCPLFAIFIKKFKYESLVTFIGIFLLCVTLQHEIKTSSDYFFNFFKLSIFWCFGYWLKQYLGSHMLNKRLVLVSTIIFFSIWILGIIGQICYIYAGTDMWFLNIDVQWSYFAPILTSAIFIIFYNFRLNDLWKKIAIFLGKVSLPMYLFQYLSFSILNVHYFNNLDDFNYYYVIFIRFIITVASTFLIGSLTMYPLNWVINETNNLIKLSAQKIFIYIKK
jgi:peptidoglycan/LPS O-acetylase OafA/YrhL